ncbi:dipeptidase [Aestuariicella sp. G3-2]|uniref:dipeptidase n=1 Tax=Pseudomaricurvus albidus TaxID=2842452 RepID=UPI001C0E1788|nr:dipeptidase [Aestuariicella albida]MBU3069651.1 dipeptidase [Aestuariicella albida]
MRRAPILLIVLPVIILLVLAAGFFMLAPAQIEKSLNRVTAHTPFPIPKQTQELHNSLIIGDLHADSTLWKRDLRKHSSRGHVDLPRLREGNVALQMFTSVTKSPRGQNYTHNATDSSDNITLLAIAQLWPIRTWNNLTERALYEAEKIHHLDQASPDEFKLILTSNDLQNLIEQRKKGSKIIGGLLGTEGSHALEGKLENIQRLYDTGYRMMGLQHFFDNQLGGSLHGESNEGLTQFGKDAIMEMERLGIMIDVAHSSPKVVEDVLALANSPLIVSHTGFYGHCPSPRNISDELMKRIAAKGGLIGVGYWKGAVCDDIPENIVQAIRYGIDLVGVDHIALGSDFDGSVSTHFNSSELAVLTDEMLKAGFTETEIRKVMGENMVRFLAQQLP